MIRALALVIVTVGAFVAAPAQAAPIKMSGSTVTRALVADLAYFYRTSTERPPRFSLLGGGAATGISDVARGIVDAGLASRDLEPTDPPGLVLTPLARSGVCLVTHRSNPVPGFSHAQVQDLVAGRIGSWAQIPGSPRTDAVVAAALDLTSGARSVFDSVFIADTTPVAYTPRTFSVAAQVRDFVERTPAAWGYVDLALAQSLNVLRYEGVPCTRETLRSGAYPAQRPLGIVTRGRPRGEVARFLRWATTSEKARAVIATRYLPVRGS